MLGFYSYGSKDTCTPRRSKPSTLRSHLPTHASLTTARMDMRTQNAGTHPPTYSPTPTPTHTHTHKHAHSECWDFTATVRRAPAHSGGPSQPHCAAGFCGRGHRFPVCVADAPVHARVPEGRVRRAHQHPQLLLRTRGCADKGARVVLFLPPILCAVCSHARMQHPSANIFVPICVDNAPIHARVPEGEFGALINIHSCFSVLEVVLTKVRELSSSCPPLCCVPQSGRRARGVVRVFTRGCATHKHIDYGLFG